VSQPEGADPDPVLVASLGEYLLWHARHEDEHGGNASGTDYWQGVARGILDGLNQHGMVVLSTAEHEHLLNASLALSHRLDQAFGDGYQQCRDELDTVLNTAPDGAVLDPAALRTALDTKAGLQFETREARIRRYNEALRFLTDPENLTWFRHTDPDLLDRLKTALRKTT
jgi:hypothetical protein